MYKQEVPQSGLQSIVPDLAGEWSRAEDRTALSFRLRQGIKWHDGKPFTAKDVVCTGFAHRQGERKAAHQPPKGLVSQPRRGDPKYRVRRDVSFKAGSAGT